MPRPCRYCGVKHKQGSKRQKECHRRHQQTQTRQRKHSPRVGTSRTRRSSAPRTKESQADRRRRVVGERREAAEVVLVSRMQTTAAEVVGVLIFDRHAMFAWTADKLLDAMPWYRFQNRSHWLCRLLDKAARLLLPGTYIQAVGGVIARELVEAGLPRFAAELVAQGVMKGIGRAVGSLGTDQLILALRALVPLVCRNFERCPVQGHVCSHLAAPGVEGALRSILQG